MNFTGSVSSPVHKKADPGLERIYAFPFQKAVLKR